MNLNVITTLEDGVPAMPHLQTQKPILEDEIKAVTICRIPHGTKEGNSAIAVVVELDGRYVFAQFSLTQFSVATHLINEAENAEVKRN